MWGDSVKLTKPELLLLRQLASDWGLSYGKPLPYRQRTERSAKIAESAAAKLFAEILARTKPAKTEPAP